MDKGFVRMMNEKLLIVSYLSRFRNLNYKLDGPKYRCL